MFDGLPALFRYSTDLIFLERCRGSLAVVIYHLLGDIINAVEHALVHYFPLTLEESFLQNSHIGSRYQKWAKFTNEDFQKCDRCLRQLIPAIWSLYDAGYDEWTGNLDALNDAFGMDFDGGLVLCFLRYDLLNAAKPEFAQGVLDIIESNSRDHLLLGRRLLALVQSDDPRIRFEPLGARAAHWNRREWFDKNRGL